MSETPCPWCRKLLLSTRQRYCSQRCRQSAWRLRRSAATELLDQETKTVAYADPPYPSSTHLYRHEPSFAGPVDHVALLKELATFHGWALSTSARDLRHILPLCPTEARVCAWVKPIGANVATIGIHNTWEPLIVLPARRLRPGKRDWLSAQPARGNGSLIGRKPIAFCTWLYGLLGIQPGDGLADLFPGTGIVARCWEQLGGVVVNRSTRQPLHPPLRSAGDPAKRDEAPSPTEWDEAKDVPERTPE